MPDRSTRHDARRRPVVALFVPSLEIGGAERQVVELARHLDASRWRVLVMTMYDHGSLAKHLESHDSVTLIRLHKQRHLPFFALLTRALLAERVDIVHAFLVTAQSWALLARILWHRKLVLAVRDARPSTEPRDPIERAFNHALTRIPNLVDFVVFNSEAAKRAKHFRMSADRMLVIPNGIDTDHFRPTEDSRLALRRKIGVDGSARLVGTVANVTVHKGHPTLVRAIAHVLSRDPSVHFVCAGDDSNPLGESIRALAQELGVQSRLHFLGQRSDVDQLLPGFDVLCSPSDTESFSNVICEGMACGLPCVVTDVGDSARIVGDTGIVVPPGDADAMGEALLRLLSLPAQRRRELGKRGRQRIIDEFSIPRMVTATQAVYERVLGLSSTDAPTCAVRRPTP